MDPGNAPHRFERFASVSGSRCRATSWKIDEFEFRDGGGRERDVDRDRDNGDNADNDRDRRVRNDED